MRIILSRKGFDAQYGGGPSPILPNGAKDLSGDRLADWALRGYH
ncbi:hypothetical protein [Kiloniella sp.]